MKFVNIFAEEQEMRTIFEAVIEGTATEEEKAKLVEFITPMMKISVSAAGKEGDNE